MWKFLGGFFCGIIITIIPSLFVDRCVSNESDDGTTILEAPIVYSCGETKFEVFQTNVPVSLCLDKGNLFSDTYNTIVAIYNDGTHFNNKVFNIEKEDTVFHIGNYRYETTQGMINIVPIIEFNK